MSDAADLALPAAVVQLATFGLTVLGLVVGSFLNVVIWRLPRGESIVHPPSHCPRCGAPILGQDNVPVVAWLWLGGRCRVCRGPISARYPVVEALTGLVTLALVLHDGLTWLLPFHLVFAWAGIALALIDLDTFLLPLELTLPLIPLSIVSALWDPDRTVLLAVIGAAVGWSMIVLIGKVGEWMLGKEAMGGGDAWLLASIGGFTGPFRLLIALFLGSVQGALLGYLLLLYRRRKLAKSPPPAAPPKPEIPPESEAVEPKPPEAEAAPEADGEDDWVPDPGAIPFGPFLMLGALETLLFGELIVRTFHLESLAELLPALR